MSFSMYHSASGMQSPHSIHVVGIGRTGVGFVDAMLREGEVEDLLEDPRARFSALAIDIGEQDMVRARDYAQAFWNAWRSATFRGIAPVSARFRSRYQAKRNYSARWRAILNFSSANFSGMIGIPTTNPGFRITSRFLSPASIFRGIGQSHLR